jgi:two-component system CheB/CheR fusion protein
MSGKKKKAPPSLKEKTSGSQKKKDPKEKQAGKDSFPIVCLGASAGGLKSMEAFLSTVPQKSGMAFVIISHSDPGHRSLLPEILERTSSIPVTTIEEGMNPEQNKIFLPPSDKSLVMEQGRFHLKERYRRDALYMPIDIFLESLAKEREKLAGCVILSGTGTDGTHGLRIIKEKGGVAMAEDKTSAGYYGMPQSAIETGLVDFVLEPQQMPGELIGYFRHTPTIVETRDRKAEEADQIPHALNKILALISNNTGHDFSLYKKSTLIRRIERRMSVTRSRNATEYIHFINQNPKESEALLQDFLIGVTEFFRDQEVFSILKEKILPGMFSSLHSNESLRVWVPGCATGEEVYSLSMIFNEYMSEHKIKCGLQLFGTDINKNAIEKARDGVYLPNIAAKVSAERLERFFHIDHHYCRVKKEIREPVVFAVQNVLRDPPFTKLDLLLCRNLLIYLEAEGHKRLIPLFHYSLKPEGILVLGPSESIGYYGELFNVVDKKYSVYRKQEIHQGIRMEFKFPTGGKTVEVSHKNLPTADPAKHGKSLSIAQATERLLLRMHTPCCVIVSQSGHILHVHGKTGKYLEIPVGKPNLEVTNLAREGLRFALSSALRQAVSSNREIRKERVRVRTNGEFQEINLTVTPLSERSQLKDTLMVVFEEVPAFPEKGAPDDANNDVARRIIELERELTSLREDYNSALEELETSNEELKSVNEEMYSQNEELQSTNEELQSSREELQSLNEELSTVNNQLQDKMEEINESYASITDVLNNTNVALLFLDNELCVKRFTTEITSLINLIDTDVGRPIEHISHNLQLDDLHEKLRKVTNTLITFEEDVQTRDGHWYWMNILVNLTRENVIEGTVLTFINIDAKKEALVKVEQLMEQEVQAAKRFCDNIVDTVRESFLVLDRGFKVLTANRRFYETFQVTPEQTEGKSLFELGDRQWDIH